MALVSDALSFGLQVLGLGLAEGLQVLIDLATAVALAVLLKVRMGLLIPFLVEAVPGLAVFPTWALAVVVWAAATPVSEA